MKQLEKGQDILKKLEFVLKDSDDLELKKRVRQFMKDFTDVFTFQVVGAANCGKTTFIRHMYLKDLPAAMNLSGSPCKVKEYRYGDFDNAISPEAGYIRHFMPVHTLDGLSVFELAEDNMTNNRIAPKSSEALFALIAADDIRNPYVWDVIEHAGKASVICILTKSDLCTDEQLKAKKDTVQGYLRESGVQAPVFAVSGLYEEEGKIDGGFADVEEYVTSFITGPHPLAKKWAENMNEVMEIVHILEQSFIKRKKQYESDRKILAKIDSRMDQLRMEQTERLEELNLRIAQICNEEIDHYRDAMIKSLDPTVIKRNFADKHACLEWMKDKAEICEKNLDEKVKSKINQLYREYIRDLTNIYEESLSYLENREFLLDAEDQFYGTLAESKKSVGKRTLEVVKVNREHYGTLMEVSSQYMDNMWASAEHHEKKINGFEATSKNLGTLISAGGAAAGLGIGKVIGLTGGMLFGSFGVGVVLGVAAAIVLYEAIKPYAESCFSDSLDKESTKHTEDFKRQVENIKQNMVSKLQQRITEMFSQEVDSMDKSFMEFRMSVNIDTKNIPVLSQEVEALKELTAAYSS